MGPWPTELADLTDDQVIECARHVYRQLQTVPRWHAGNDALIREWGAVCREMARRGITDTVTEGGATGATAHPALTAPDTGAPGIPQETGRARARAAADRSLAAALIISAAASRTCSRRARSAAVSPPPPGYLTSPA